MLDLESKWQLSKPVRPSSASPIGWRTESFRNLDPKRTMRLVIPSITSVTLGVQIILSSFFLSILGIKQR
jgi:hypothetical protein